MHIEPANTTGLHLVLLDYVYANPIQALLLVAGLLLLILIVIGILLYHKAKDAKRMWDALYLDPLTGHGNYKSLCEAAPKLIQSDPDGYALMYLDASQFKYINDTYGYAAGDEVLIAISNTLEKAIGHDELFARVYADRFVLLLRYPGDAEFRERLDVLSKRLRELNCPVLEQIDLIFNGGIYCFKDGMCDIKNAFDRANYALNTLQTQFFNSFAFYDTVFTQRIKEEKVLERQMHAALENNEIIPYYQPKVNVLTGGLVGAEALARWVFADGNYISPADFIPFFERNGFVTSVDFHIFESVCRDLRRWLDQGIRPAPISVNLSRRHIENEQFAEQILEIATFYQVPPALLELEVTETIALDNLDRAVEFAKSLNACGFPLTIDDYGTGFSSIVLLQRMPLSAVKLDKSFLESAMESTKAKDIMRHLVLAIKNNGIQIICEGVERQEQVELMKEMNCAYAQGFLYGRPMTHDAYDEFQAQSVLEEAQTLELVQMRDLRNYSLASDDFLSRVLPGGFVLCGGEPDFSILYANQYLLDNLGYGEQEFMFLTQSKLTNCVHPDEREQTASLLRSICHSAGDEHNVQLRMQRKDGGRLDMSAVIKKVLMYNGKIALLCVCTDITQLVKLQEDRNALLSAVPGGIYELLLLGEGNVAILSATDQVYEIIGHPEHEFNSGYATLIDLVEPQDREMMLRLFSDMRKRGCDLPKTTLRIRHSDSSMHWVSVQGTLRNTERGLVLTAIIQDMDGEIRRREEEALMRRKLRLFIAILGCGDFQYDIVNNCILRANAAALQYIPKESWENLPESMIELARVHPEDIPALRRFFLRAAKGGIACEKLRLKHGDDYRRVVIGLCSRDIEWDEERRATGLIAPLE